MHSSFKRFACLTLGLGLVGACDPEPTDPRDVVEGPVVCGGFGGLECPDGQVCVDDPNDDCDPKDAADCGGICVPPEPAPCGGFGGFECPEGQVCVDDPNDDCDPKDAADCIGICEPAPAACGGFGGLECPKGQACVDDPNDDCDPDNGGYDCIGVCEPAQVDVKAPKPPKGDKGDKGDKSCDDDKDRHYVSHDPKLCAAILFQCVEGQTAFFDACGCGCE